jgi:hypothetical protein
MCTTWKELPSWEDDPEVRNPKGFIMRHSFPELFGPTRTVQLRTKLGGAGFKGVRVTRPAGGLLGTWKIEMRSDISSPSSRKIVAEIRQIASTLGFELDRKTIKTKITGTRIIVSFTALM